MSGRQKPLSLKYPYKAAGEIGSSIGKNQLTGEDIFESVLLPIDSELASVHWVPI